MEIPRYWRLKTQRYRLEGSVCTICGRLTFLHRPVCAQCHCAAQPIQIACCGIPVVPALNRIEDAFSLKG